MKFLKLLITMLKDERGDDGATIANAVDALKKLGEDFTSYKKTASEFKESVEKELKAVKENKGIAEITEKQEKMNTDLVNLEKSMQELQEKAKRPSVSNAEEKEQELIEAKKLMRETILQGKNCSPEIAKHMNELGRKGWDEQTKKSFDTLTPAAGGVLVPQVIRNQMSEVLFNANPIRQYCDSERVSFQHLDVVLDTEEAVNSWVSETGARPETNTTNFGSRRIAAHENYAMPKLSMAMLEDPQFDVSSYIMKKAGEAFGKSEGLAFISGDGVNKPKGITSYAEGTDLLTQIKRINSGSLGALTADSILDAFLDFPQAYQSNLVTALSVGAIKEVRKLKDTQGRYLWGDGLNSSVGPLLNGRPYVIMDGLPTVADNSESMIVGDFKKGYLIVDKIDLMVILDNISVKGFVFMYLRRRVGGDVIDHNAFRIIKATAL